MARWLKRGASVDENTANELRVRTAVEAMLADIAERGEAAVRELSVKFDNWDRDDYRLTDAEIRECLSQLSHKDFEDIKFAQAQVRNFAELQRASIKDIEVETLPGVVLGHKNIPVQSVGLLRARRPISAARLRPYDGHHRESRGRIAQL